MRATRWISTPASTSTSNMFGLQTTGGRYRRIHPMWPGIVVLLCAWQAHGDPGHYLEPRERELGTHSKLSRSFHVVADEPQGFGLRMEGILVGIEKSDRELLGVSGLSDDPNLNAAPRGFNREMQKRYERRLDDGRRTFISHVVEAQLDADRPIAYIRNRFLYDAYCQSCEDARRPSRPLWAVSGSSPYDRSWNALQRLEQHIAARLAEAAAADAAYSHVIVATMGWNTPQEKAIRNINSIFGNILEAADSRFKPLFIAITWPSSWSVPGVSLKNKADDADEIGYVWANALLNRHLSSLRSESGAESWPEFKLVAIGHSLGARLVTRAAFSGTVLDPPVDLKDGPDLVIGLQGAFSMNRFLAERRQGREGAPYSQYAQLRGPLVLTWSDQDSATPLGNYLSGANYSGAKAGYERASDGCYEHHFSFLAVSESGELLGALVEPGSERTVKMIDASALVKYSVLGTGGGAHSDIYNAYMGRFLMRVIESATQSSNSFAQAPAPMPAPTRSSDRRCR